MYAIVGGWRVYCNLGRVKNRNFTKSRACIVSFGAGPGGRHPMRMTRSQSSMQELHRPQFMKFHSRASSAWSNVDVTYFETVRRAGQQGLGVFVCFSGQSGGRLSQNLTHMQYDRGHVALQDFTKRHTMR